MRGRKVKHCIWGGVPHLRCWTCLWPWQFPVCWEQTFFSDLESREGGSEPSLLVPSTSNVSRVSVAGAIQSSNHMKSWAEVVCELLCGSDVLWALVFIRVVGQVVLNKFPVSSYSRSWDYIEFYCNLIEWNSKMSSGLLYAVVLGVWLWYPVIGLIYKLAWKSCMSACSCCLANAQWSDF